MVDARSLFPDLFPQDTAEQVGKVSTPSLPLVDHEVEQSAVPPPPPPDISWLKDHRHENLENGEIAYIPSALVLTSQETVSEPLIKVFNTLGYQTETAEDAVEALHKLLFLNYAVVVLDVAFEHGKSLDKSVIHTSMNSLPMHRRRLMYYILIGPGFQTLYNLQAFSNSANLVINTRNIDHFESIFRKGIKDYEELIAPLLQSLEHSGKYR